MPDINLRRDGFVIGLFVLMIVLLVSALTGAHRVFGYALVLFLGLLLGLGFVRRGVPATWGPPLVATAVLLIAFTGMFANEAVVVTTSADTTLGFHPGTAFLVYGVWIPSFLTAGVGFALTFPRLDASDEDAHGTGGAR